MKYRFFKGGYLSNWYPSKMVVTNLSGTNTFESMEQYMMWSKAKYFEDEETALKILETADPAEAKALGRQVKGFKGYVWDVIKTTIIVEGLYYKFGQNPELLKQLKNEDCDLFVEASPSDKIWGIGLSEKDAKKVKEEDWPGQNLLGKCITLVRDLFLEDEKDQEDLEVILEALDDES